MPGVKNLTPRLTRDSSRLAPNYGPLWGSHFPNFQRAPKRALLRRKIDRFWSFSELRKGGALKGPKSGPNWKNLTLPFLVLLHGVSRLFRNIYNFLILSFERCRRARKWASHARWEAQKNMSATEHGKLIFEFCDTSREIIAKKLCSVLEFFLKPFDRLYWNSSESNTFSRALPEWVNFLGTHFSNFSEAPKRARYRGRLRLQAA